MNGAQSDELNDVNLRWKSRVFSTPVNNLIKEILELGGEAELDRSFDQFRKEVEPALHQIRDRLNGCCDGSWFRNLMTRVRAPAMLGSGKIGALCDKNGLRGA